MKLRVVQIYLLAALLGLASVQAVVVVGGGAQQLGNNNRNGYRYNGPAHKYLPAEEPLHQQHHQEEEQQQQQQHHHNQQQAHSQGFNGPFNREYYEGQRHQEQQEENSWQKVFSQQQPHQGHQQHHQGLDYQPHNHPNQISGYQEVSGSLHQQHNQLHIPVGHQQEVYQQQQHNHHQQQQQEGLGHQHSSSGHHKEHSYESGYGQQHQQVHGQQNHRLQGQGIAGGQSWNSNLGQGAQRHQQQQQQQQHEYSQHIRGDSWQQGQEGLGGAQSWNSNRGGESWNSQCGHPELSQQRGESWQQLTGSESWNHQQQQQQGSQGGPRGSETWNSNREQQAGETWPGSSHRQQQQQQHQHHGDSLWHPIREHELEKLPIAVAHASSQKAFAQTGGKDVKLVPAYTLSSDAEHDRFIGLDAQDTRLLHQGLPSAYRKHTFASPVNQRVEQQLGGGAAASTTNGGKDFLQMQSHSYQLPSTHSTHREWLQPQEQHRESSSSSSSYSPLGGNRQYSVSAYAQSSPGSHSPHGSHSSPGSISSSPGSLSSTPGSPNGINHPSREFQAPYY